MLVADILNCNYNGHAVYYNIIFIAIPHKNVVPLNSINLYSTILNE